MKLIWYLKSKGVLLIYVYNKEQKFKNTVFSLQKSKKIVFAREIFAMKSVLGLVFTWHLQSFSITVKRQAIIVWMILEFGIFEMLTDDLFTQCVKCTL